MKQSGSRNGGKSKSRLTPEMKRKIQKQKNSRHKKKAAVAKNTTMHAKPREGVIEKSGFVASPKNKKGLYIGIR